MEAIRRQTHSHLKLLRCRDKTHAQVSHLSLALCFYLVDSFGVGSDESQPVAGRRQCIRRARGLLLWHADLVGVVRPIDQTGRSGKAGCSSDALPGN